MKPIILNKNIQKIYKPNISLIVKYVTSIPIVYSCIHLFCNNIISMKISANIDSIYDFIYNVTQCLLITGNCIIDENLNILNIENVYFCNNKMYYNDVLLSNYTHIKYINILNEIWCTSPLESAFSILNTYLNIDLYMQNLLRHGGRNSGLLFSSRFLGDEIKKKISYRIDDFYNDIKNNAGALIIDGGFTWQDIMISPDKMNITEIKTKIERQVCALFNIPPCLLGIFDTTYNNYEISLQQFIKHSLYPLIHKIILILNQKFKTNIVINL